MLPDNQDVIWQQRSLPADLGCHHNGMSPDTTKNATWQSRMLPVNKRYIPLQGRITIFLDRDGWCGDCLLIQLNSLAYVVKSWKKYIHIYIRLSKTRHGHHSHTRQQNNGKQTRA